MNDSPCLSICGLHVGDIIREDLLWGTIGRAFLYATFFLGLTLLPSTVPNCQRLYSFDPTNDRSSIPGRDLLITDYQRYGSRNWKQFHQQLGTPDVLFVRLRDKGGEQERWLTDFVKDHHMWPLIVVMEDETHVTGRMGTSYKQRHKYFGRHGYSGLLKYLSGQSAGAAVDRGNFWTFYTPTSGYQKEWGTINLGTADSPPRSVSNCLQHSRISHRIYVDPETIQSPSLTDKPMVVGYHRKRAIYGSGGPIPPDQRCYVIDRWGIRPVLLEEWKTIMGVPAGWQLSRKTLTRLLHSPTSQEWSVVVHAATKFLVNLPSTNDAIGKTPNPVVSVKAPTTLPSTWSWSPPELGPASDFRAKRISNMHKAIWQVGGGHGNDLERT